MLPTVASRSLDYKALKGRGRARAKKMRDAQPEPVVGSKSFSQPLAISDPDQFDDEDIGDARTPEASTVSSHDGGGM